MRDREDRLKAGALSCLLLLLGGCAHLNNNFDCPMKSGVRCESLDAVNDKIDRGEIGQEASAGHWKNTTPVWTGATVQTTGSTTPARTKEAIRQVWIAPFEDSDGNWHQATSLYTVTRAGQWMTSGQAGRDQGGRA